MNWMKSTLVLAAATLVLASCNIQVTPNIPGNVNQGFSCIPIGQQQFSNMTSVISNRMMESDKLNSAKQQTTTAGCMTSQQISQVTSMLMMESSKLDYAKFAFSYCADKRNYGIINNHLMMESSKRELGQITGVN